MLAASYFWLVAEAGWGKRVDLTPPSRPAADALDVAPGGARRSPSGFALQGRRRTRPNARRTTIPSELGAPFGELARRGTRRAVRNRTCRPASRPSSGSLPVASDSDLGTQNCARSSASGDA